MSKNNKKKANFPFLSNMEDVDAPVIGDFENDASLEAELLELLGGGANSAPKKEKNKRKDVKPITIDNNLLNLDFNDDIKDDDIDENDPELLAELNEFLNEKTEEQIQNCAPVSTTTGSVAKLENLKNLYEEAIKQSSNDPSKSRRYDRSLKQINELLQKALKGQPVDESEFPPIVHITTNIPKIEEIKENKSNQPQLVDKIVSEPPNKSFRNQSPKEEKKGVQNNILDTLIRRQMEYKAAAVEYKSKDIEMAKGLMIVVKQFDEVIKSVKAGEPFDLEDLPPPPSEFQLSDLNLEQEEPAPIPIEHEKPSIQPLGEELKLRLAFYKDSAAKAKSEGNDSKARRLLRVIQQYEEANEAFRKHLPFSFEELPPPPGRPPLSNQSVAPKVSQKPALTHPIANKPHPVSKNMKLLLDRQAEFKAAALKAKLEGDLPMAKELLRQSMGFDKMIQAVESGLPVDLSKLPSLPTETDYNFEMINVDQCEIPAEMLNVSKETLFKQLQITLLEQINVCKKYMNTVTIAGDIIGAKRFENLAKSCEKDLNGLKCLIQKNAEIPQFHYEYKMFSVIQSNPDLGENEMSSEVIKGTNFGLPSGYSAEQFDTYVVLELPFPTDAFQTFTTETIRKTNSPSYNSTNKFQVNLKSRVFQRIVKNKQLKADIYFKRGFLQKDKLYGTCQIKLEKLESQCVIHDTFDITENRKVIAGKLEIKLRIRNPVFGNQSEHIKEKWLVIDDFNQKNNISPTLIASTGNRDSTSFESVSIDVLKYEIGDLKRKIGTSGSQMSPALASALKQKIADKELTARKQEQKLNSPDPSVKLAYLQSILKLPQEFNNEAKKFLSENKRDKAQISITKKKLVEKEIEHLKESMKLKS